jgi:tetratricopeptide (TPR) repeat protein
LNTLQNGRTDRAEKLADLKKNFYSFFVNWAGKQSGHNFWDFALWEVERHKKIYLELPNLTLSLDWAYENKDWPCVLALTKAIVHPIYYQGQLEKRIKCSELGLLAAQALAAVEDEIWFTIQGLGSIYLLRGDHENTRACLTQGIKLAQAHHSSDGIALGEIYLGYLAIQTGQLTEAQTHIDLALSQAQDPILKYRAHHAAGHVARYLKNYEQAREYYLKSAEFLESIGYVDTSDVWLGFTQLGLKKYEKAKDYFRRYLETYNQYGNQRVVGMAKLGLAQYYEVQGQLQEASVLADEAHQILAKLNAQWELKQVKDLKDRLANPGGAPADG